MSLKPAKKGDRGKPWMNRGRRNKVVKIRLDYHLIVTEGTRTEPEYFGAIREIINRKNPNRIQLEIVGAGDNTLALFDAARKLVRKNLNGYAHVWIVYDTDDFPPERVDQTARLCDECNEAPDSETKYHAIWSNQCIELWFLLHFDYFQTDIHRNEYMSKINVYFKRLGRGEYTKSRGDMFEILRPKMQTAIRNAEKLDGRNENLQPSQSRPGTKVYELVKYLLPYFE